MKWSNLGSTWEASRKISSYLMVMNGILTIAVFLLTARIFSMHERVVTLPASVNSKYEIGWADASSEYYQDIALWFSSSIGTANKNNVDRILLTLNRFFDPSISKKVSEDIHAYVAKLPEGSDPVSWLSADKIIWEAPTSKVFVSGTLNTQLTSGPTASIPITYEYTMGIQGGLPHVTDFTSYSSNEPHTLAWIHKQEEDAKK